MIMASFQTKDYPDQMSKFCLFDELLQAMRYSMLLPVNTSSKIPK